ncbi:uncharacterized protein TRIADDRAFT_21124 [Trichoplax adhaerens]|uniref:SMP-LTD domain-containing protein n=1 Tax=Trichoplax adhaerens TaxID=10228 RepID=B3RQ21_TRIAD|nr:hypothetical protein TRIADDRAFT_21124 [Trichoplax adhaerens]EDV28278.1 hypothetical protein TRIADDRAFT_21124 [Trichoplax adhaerens]|eukprot:XP_002110112.1 hypothetical protein TRIADDRAFT_21124 [Trichoplax adhaerens]
MYGKRKYDQDQHYKTDLRCIYARLDGSVLRLSKPQSDDLTIPFKPEKWNVSFVNQKLLDITNAKIQLIPKTLSKNKLWSKKYPICITLAEGKSFSGAPTAAVDKSPLEYQPASGKVQLPTVDPSPNIDSEKDRSFYLFATTSHDKEYWFYRLQYGTESKKEETLPIDKEPKVYPPSHPNVQPNRSKTFAEMQAIYYSRYMAKLILQVDNKPKSKQQQPAAGKNPVETSVVSWLNALLGRAFFDFWREKYWSDKMVNIIQRRISKLNRPNYIKELIVTDLDLGGSLPAIRGASSPTLDERGLWIDLDVSYHGSFTIALETSLNITRQKPDGEMEVTDPKKETDPSKNDLIFTLQGLDKSDSESSDDEADDPTLEKQSSSSSIGSSQHNGNSRWSRFIKKVGKSKIVQKATNSRLAQKAAERVSNIPIILAVEIQSVTGILALNIPPPPSDRLWYGFRGNPTVLMSVRPKLGERKVRLTNITDWIEKKLRHEIKETIVLPHMIDYKIALMGNTMTEIAIS